MFYVEKVPQMKTYFSGEAIAKGDYNGKGYSRKDLVKTFRQQPYFSACWNAQDTQTYTVNKKNCNLPYLTITHQYKHDCLSL